MITRGLRPLEHLAAADALGRQVRKLHEFRDLLDLGEERGGWLGFGELADFFAQRVDIIGNRGSAACDRSAQDRLEFG